MHGLLQTNNKQAQSKHIYKLTFVRELVTYIAIYICCPTAIILVVITEILNSCMILALFTIIISEQ